MLSINGPVMKSVESVLRPEESLWWERFAKRGRFWAGSERERELREAVIDGESGQLTQ